MHHSLNKILQWVFLICFTSNLYAGSLGLDYVEHRRITCGTSGPEEISGRISYQMTLSGGESINTITYTLPDLSTLTGNLTISGLTQIGLYELEVETNQGTYTDNVYLGYSVQWDFYSCCISDITSSPYQEDLVNKRGANGWCTSAGSKNILPGGQEGSVVYKAVGTSVPRMFGFDLIQKPTHCYGGLDYGVYLTSSGGITRQNGTSQSSVGSYSDGDVIEVRRFSSGANYYVGIYRNGTQLTTTSINSTTFNQDWQAGGWIYTNNAKLENVCTSFKPPFPVELEMVNAACSTGENGEIHIVTCGDSTLYTVDWEDASVDDYFFTKYLDVGDYHVTINKGADWQVEKWINVGYRVDWSDETGVTTSNGDIEKTGSSGWNAGTVSQKVYNTSNEGWYEFEIDAENQLLDFGLSISPTAYSQSDLDYGLDKVSGDVLWLVNSGVPQGAYPRGILREGDIVKILIEPSTNRIKMFVNGYYRAGEVLTDVFGTSDDVNIHILMNTNGSSLKDFRGSVACDPMADFKYYAKLKESLGSNYTYLDNDILSFYMKSRNQKGVNDFLEYSVYDNAGNMIAGVSSSGNPLVASSPILKLKYDDNFFDLDLSPFSLSTGFYTLEVKTENGLTKKLKFKK